ncbi:MAG: hypothetical protein HY547_00005, partial [Elusimicrobia bacterium]|nr:hypothetical protein [Elusimicrobiota bacterium]
MNIVVTAVSDRTGSIINGASYEGHIRNVRIVSATGINNGKIFTLNTVNSDSWLFENIKIPGGVGNGGTWDYAWYVGGVSAGTVADTHLNSVLMGYHVWNQAAYVFDSGLDTFDCRYCGGSVLALDSKNYQAPRWIRFIHSFTEAIDAQGNASPASGIGLDIRSARDFRWIDSYVASSKIGASIGASAQDVDISHSIFVSIKENAIQLAAGAKAVHIADNTFEDVGYLTSNTYDAISIAAGAAHFAISSNQFKLFSTNNVPRYDIFIATGASDNYQITENNFATFGTAAISDGGTGSNKVILGNVPNTVVSMTSGTVVLNGNVGIGTASPKVSLHNSGDFITKGPWTDVRAFGAKGDGTTDDTAAIQAAIDAAKGSVYFSAGIYAISATIKLRSATAFYGPTGGTFLPGQEHPTSGYGASLKWIGASDGVMVESLNLQNVFWSGIDLEGVSLSNNVTG